MKNIINNAKRFPLIVAEIGQAHEGSVGLAHSFIDAIADCGADAVKFQCHLSEFESSKYDKFRKKIRYLNDKTRYDYWKRMEFSLEEWFKLKQHSENRGLTFLCSPFSTQAVDILNKIKIEAFKIGSGEVNNYELINHIAKTKKPIIFSSGLSYLDELSKSIDIVQKFHKKIAILYCVTKYPSKPKDIDLNKIIEIKNKFKLVTGFSDHSGSIYPSIGALTIGSNIIEIHVTFDKKMFGFDSSSSLNFSQLKDLIEARDIIFEITNKKKNKEVNLDRMRKLFGRSYFLKADINKNEVVKTNHLILKKPGIGISQDKKKDIIGKKTNKKIKKGSLLSFKDLK